MSKFVYLISALLLFAVLIIVVHSTRQTRAPYSRIDTNSASSDSLSSAQNNPSYQRLTEDANVKKAISSIFTVGSEDGLVLFPNKFEHEEGMQGDEGAGEGGTYHPDQPFKVQRSPDGKLSAVFPNYLIFQTSTASPSRSYSQTNPRQNSKMNQKQKGDDSCELKSFDNGNCLKVKNYIEKTQLNKVSPEELSKFAELFGEDSYQPEIEERMKNSEMDEEYFCDSISKLYHPQDGITLKNEHMYIVNNETLRQGIRADFCRGEEKPCNHANIAPIGYKMICKQHYSYRPMVAVVNGKLQKEMFRTPSCCKCALISTIMG